MLNLFRRARAMDIPHSVDDIVAMLGLSLHPEMGYVREMFRSPVTDTQHDPCACLAYLLLVADHPLSWHRVPGTRIWHWYAGAPLQIEYWQGDHRTRLRISGNLLQGERPQAVIPPHSWQRASSSGEWTLMGYSIVPGAGDITAIEFPPADWQPPVT